ncbi:MAG TPA: hypothetical protein PKY70_05145 [Nakamurella multipartita]|nr:hypothetical protein [Nakamurella multipartita]
MVVDTKVALAPITPADIDDVARFLQANMQSGVSAETWSKALNPPWRFLQPNHGFLLRTDDAIVGVYLAFYSERILDGQVEAFCNLAAWCVLEEHRGRGLRLLRRMLGQPGYHFTDLSPSGNVVALNKRLKFVELDTTTAVVPNIPLPIRSARVQIVTDPEDIDAQLSEQNRLIYRDHRGLLGARHLLLRVHDRQCYVMYRRDRRKRLPLFASVLYVSDSEVFRHTNRYFFRHLLLRHAIPFTLVELRVGGHRPRGSILRQGRPRMFRSASLRAEQIDYLYSELTCVPW